MISKIRVLISTMTLMLAILACQEDLHEVNQSAESNISFASDLSGLISSATLKDGSYDNILDNTSALSLQLPVDVIANGQALTISSEADFENIQTIYNQERYLPDSIQLVYPVRGYLSDFREVILNDINELEAVVAQSVEGGDDEDIECYRFNFPLSIAIYDTQNQRSSTTGVNSDQELYQVFNRLSADHLASFSYPISLTSSEGEVQSISSNLELENLLSSAISLCDEGDEKYYKPEDFAFNTSTLRVKMTDAPFPFEFVVEANVTIDKIELKPANEEEEFIILSEEEMAFNLLDLTNGITTTLVDMEIPTGSYNQIRMRVIESSVLLTDDRIFDLKIPSGEQSGIKVKFPSTLDIAEGEDSELLLDFDVSRSFKAQGNAKNISSIKGFIFTPVIKATQPKETGELTGHVTDISSSLAIEGVQLSVFAADTLNTSTFTDSDGNYTVMGLLPGSYSITAEQNDYLTETVENVDIQIGEKTKVDIELILE
ncbi:DUF4382 domain-containing protein [Reichenbachiella sp.]